MKARLSDLVNPFGTMFFKSSSNKVVEFTFATTFPLFSFLFDVLSQDENNRTKSPIEKNDFMNNVADQRYL